MYTSYRLSFLRSSNADPQACFQTKLTTIDGDCFALIGSVIENSPIVSEPFQLLQKSDEEKQLYPSDGGLVLKLKRSTASSVDTQVVVKHSSAASKKMDLWTSRQTHDFEGSCGVSVPGQVQRRNVSCLYFPLVATRMRRNDMTGTIPDGSNSNDSA
jgi:hypothetical protein